MKETYSFNDFTYTGTSNSETGKIEVDIKHNKKKPRWIYKYYPISDYSIDAIINSYFYSSHPFELNDNLDSSMFLMAAKQPLDFSYYKSHFGACLPSKELKELYTADKLSDNVANGFISLFWQLISNIFGIISLTSEDKNPLMWPHYTQESGLQIKFASENMEKSLNNNLEHGECFGMYPINYSQQLRPIDVSQFKYPTVPFFYLTNVKSAKWSHENEWRIILSKNQMGVPYEKAGLDPRPNYQVNVKNRYAYYDGALVEEITLGHNFFTGKNFRINRPNENVLLIEPLNSEKHWNYKNYINLLNFICEHHSEKLFLSGTRYQMDEDQEPYLERTKERFFIRRTGNSYILERTNEVI